MKMESRVLLIIIVVVVALALGLNQRHTCLSYHWDHQEFINEATSPSPSPKLISSWYLVNNSKFMNTQNNQLLADLQNVELETVPLSNREIDASTISSNMMNFYRRSQACQLVQIVHLLYQTGCQPKAIASFACAGSCPSYVQTSTSKFWQHERSCSCCQQTSLQEATFTLDCPSLDPPYRKVKTYSPVDCMCRACTDLGKEDLQPQELVEVLANGGKNSGNDVNR